MLVEVLSILSLFERYKTIFFIIIDKIVKKIVF